MSRQLRVIHVTQASSGGVLNSLIQLARSQSSVGVAVSIIYSARVDTPAVEKLIELLGPDIRLIRAPGIGMGPLAGIRLLGAILRGFREIKPDVVHLHSSFAGAIGRVAAFFTFRQSITYYSPHGFAFLREDLPHWKRRMLATIERVLHLSGSSMILVSQSERHAASRSLSGKRLFVLENGIATDSLPGRSAPSHRITIGSAGRVTYQKAPWNFSKLSAALSSRADFLWIGGATTAEAEEWLSPASVTVTGWLSEEVALSRLADLDIYVSTSLWEGLPISVIQAQALGIPCVVSRCIGNVDLVEHGITGYLYEDEDSLEELVSELIENEDLRNRIGENARIHALARFDNRKLGPLSMHIYKGKRPELEPTHV